MRSTSLPRKLAAYSIAAGVAVTATSAQGALQVFDHRSSPLGANVEDNYSVWDHDLAVLYMDGSYKLSTHDGVGYTFYDENGVTTPIEEADKIDGSIWFEHHDFLGETGSGMKGYDGLFAYSGNGGVAGNLVGGSEDVNDLYETYHTNDPDLGLEGLATEVDNSLNYQTDPGVGVVMYGNGGVSSSPGWGGSSAWGSRKGFGGTGFVGFYFDDVEGRHYGWVEVGFGYRPYGMSIYGWAYETASDTPAPLTYDPPAPDGDFDGDGDIDADDIDILCANMGGDVGTYDLDGSGVVDEDDMIYLVETLVEYDTDDDGTPDGTGSYRGDFNLDGVVNATDLQIMKGSFGLSGVGYAAGNANCDTVVNATDLQILKGSFGLSASGVPEPATLAALALGASGVLAHRRRKNG